MKSFLLLTLSLLAVGPALALDQEDAGTYAVVHKDGHVTDRIARLGFADGRWHMESRNPDGSWEDVTCEQECQLLESTAEQVQAIVDATPLAGTAMECVHDQAFAFCRAGAGAARSYYMLAFIGDRVMPVKWVRIDPTTLAPVAVP